MRRAALLAVVALAACGCSGGGASSSAGSVSLNFRTSASVNAPETICSPVASGIGELGSCSP